MAFKFVKSLSGGEVHEDIPQGNVAIVKDSVIYATAGFALDTTVSDIKTHSIIGVSQEAVDNSGGSNGDLAIQAIVSPGAVYLANTTDTPTQAQMWLSVTLDSALVVDENDASTTDTGVIQLRQLISGTDKLVHCKLNFHPPADS